MADDIGSLVVRVGMDSNLFTKGVKDINKKMAVLKSEFQATSSHLKQFGSSTDQLKNKADFLSRQFEMQKAKVQSLAKAYEKSKKETGENSKATQELAIQLNRAVSDFNRIESELKQTTTQLDKQTSKWGKLKNAISTTQSKLTDIGGKMVSAGKTLTTAITLPIVGAGIASVKLASDLQESTNKVDVAFGSSSGKVKEFANTTLKSFGIAKGSALDMASLFGDMGTSMGLSQEQASNMSTSLVGLAGDLSSFKNIDIKEAETALNGIFTGETESLKRLGVVMTDANLQQYAYSKGIKTKIQDMGQAEKVQLRYNYVMDMTKNAHGDFARTSGGTANQMRIFKESLKEVGATMGEQILPIITPVIQKINEWVQAFGKLDDKTKKIILVVAGIVAIIPPIIMGLGALALAIGAITAPIAIAALAIAGVIVIGVLLYKNWDKIKAKAIELKDAVVKKFQEIVAGIKGKFTEIGTSIGNTWGKIKGFFTSIGNGIKTAWEVIKAVVSIGIEIITGIIRSAILFITLPWRFIWENCKDTLIKAWLIISTKVRFYINLVRGVITSVFNSIKSFISPIWDNIKSKISSVWDNIKSKVTSAINTVKSIITTVFNAVKGVVSSIWESIKSKISSVWSSLVGVFSSIGNSIKSAVSRVFDGVKTAISDKIEGAKDLVSRGLDKIKGLFNNLGLKFPDVKVPHFSLSTGSKEVLGQTITYPTGFDVSWYAKGGIFNSPQVIGVGEAGTEAVLPINRLDDIMASALRKAGVGGGSGINIQNLNVYDKGDQETTLNQIRFLSEF